MRLTRRVMLAAALAGLIAGPPAGLAAEPPYLAAGSLDLALLLPPPPPPGSAAQAAELEAVIAAQQAASPERRAQAAADANESVFDMFGDTIGPRFAAAALPATSRLFARLGATEDSVLDPVKQRYGRVRPWLADPRVQALARPSRSGSYPSGHATRVTLDAAVLAALLPGQHAAIWARAGDYARSRVIAGMHYPGDIEAGQRAGTALAALLFATPAFQADVAAAGEELRTTLGQ